MSYSSDSLVTRMQDHIDSLNELIDRFADEQNEDSDEGNADRIESARRSVGDAEGAIMDLVP